MSSRTGFVGIGLLVAAATSWGAEPERPACWVLAQGTYARECLAVLGRDCVEIVPLPEAAAPADRLPGAKASDGDRPLPAAIVVQVGDDDLAARFWIHRPSMGAAAAIVAAGTRAVGPDMPVVEGSV
jgi:hypothetical protein